MVDFPTYLSGGLLRLCLPLAWHLLITVAPAGSPPPITRHPVSQRATLGSSVVMIGGTSDIRANSYQWEKDGHPIANATSAQLHLRNVQPLDEGDYRLIITNNFNNPSTPPRGVSFTRLARLDVILPALNHGIVDVSFNDSLLEETSVRAVIATPDGGCIVGGDIPPGNIFKLLPDGSEDPSFNAIADGRIRAIAAHGNGWLVGGDFATFNGASRAKLARLESTGILDRSFNPLLTANVRAIAVHTIGSENSILLGLSASPWLVRLHPDGTRDHEFALAMANSGLNNRVSTIAIQPDGKILIGGRFFAAGNWPYDRVARLLASGVPDNTSLGAFKRIINSDAGSEVLALAVQPNGRIVLGGDFTRFNNLNRFYLARAFPDGQLDPDFTPGVGAPVAALALQQDNDIIVGGEFSRIAGANVRSLARLKIGGAADTTWHTYGFDGNVQAIALSGPHVYVGGSFSQPHSGIVRLITGRPRPLLTTTATRVIEEGASFSLTTPIHAGPQATFLWFHNDSPAILTSVHELHLARCTTNLTGNWSVEVLEDQQSIRQPMNHLKVVPRSLGEQLVTRIRPTDLPITLPTIGTLTVVFPAHSAIIEHVKISLQIDHSDVNDLAITLTSPGGQSVRLVDPDTQRRGSNFDLTIFDDNAPLSIDKGAAPFRGSYQPIEAFGFNVFRTLQPSGDWKLKIDDRGADNSSASLRSALLELFSPAAPVTLATWRQPPPMLTAGLNSNGTFQLPHWAAPVFNGMFSVSSDLVTWRSLEIPDVVELQQFPDQSAIASLAVSTSPSRFFRIQRAP